MKPIIGLEAYLTPKTHRSERKRVQFGDGTGDDVASKGAYTHMTMWASDSRGHAQPVPAELAELAWRASSTSRAPTGSC